MRLGVLRNCQVHYHAVKIMIWEQRPSIVGKAGSIRIFILLNKKFIWRIRFENVEDINNNTTHPMKNISQGCFDESKTHWNKDEGEILRKITCSSWCPWCSRYRSRKWTRRHEFNSWTILIAFHIALIPLGKVWIQLFSLQLWVNSRTG